MHNAIVGASYSGKSWLAKRMAADALKRGENVSVFDPLKTQWPRGAKCFGTVEGFLMHIETLQSAHVFVDECKVLFNEAPKEGEKLLYQKRHQGLMVYLIGQRAESMMPPNARNQCSKLFAFKQSVKDAKFLAEEYSQEMLLQLPKMKKCEFLVTDAYQIGRFKLDFPVKGEPPKIVPQK